jgi:hypothetical protein
VERPDPFLGPDAYKASSESHGSVKALLIPLLTSDAFLHQKLKKSSLRRTTMKI